jgi:quercetin dioxygenase-like cupin family protein
LALAILRKIGAIGSKFAPDPPRGNFNQPNQGGRNMKVLFSTIAMAALLGASATRAQDPVKVDPKHYTVVFENDEVRVLRIHYAPGEKSVMHSHPDSVAVFFEDQKAKMTYPDGKSEEMSPKKGDAVFTPAGAHLPENIGSGPIDLILVELKKPAAK